MDVGRNSTVDALCRRRCAFALYRLPGEAPLPRTRWEEMEDCVCREDRNIHFCMQADGGTSSRTADEAGFLLAPYDGSELFIRRELVIPPPAEAFAPLPPQKPATPATSREKYDRLFALYTAQMPQPLSKIVLARTEDVAKDDRFSPSAAFEQMSKRSPQHFNVLLHTVEHGTWLCSTPELLLKGNGFSWQTMALAGTRPACDGEDAPWDAKNRREQQLVTDYIIQCLQPLWNGGTLFGPDTLRTGQIEHLCTRFCFRMDAERLGELLSTLPPTPAVCGYPPQAARSWLRRHPDIERGLYAGYLGPVSEKDVQLFVTLRCMRLYSDVCRLYAGGGLMPDSDAAAEWQETQAKMSNMRQLLHP